jgi:tellurite resistance protein
MASIVQSSFSEELTQVWLHGLMSVAWADGEFTQEERDLISSLTQQDLSRDRAATFTTIAPEKLATVFGQDQNAAENFLRMAVMVALADRSYSEAEDTLLNQYCQALGLNRSVLDSLRGTLHQVCAEAEAAAQGKEFTEELAEGELRIDPLNPVKDWLDQMQIQDPKVAHFLCRMIPPQCPFERDVSLFGKKIAHIPALCKLNPLYEQFVGLRFRALSYLADDCGEDISAYY